MRGLEPEQALECQGPPIHPDPSGDSPRRAGFFGPGQRRRVVGKRDRNPDRERLAEPSGGSPAGPRPRSQPATRGPWSRSAYQASGLASVARVMPIASTMPAAQAGSSARMVAVGSANPRRLVSPIRLRPWSKPGQHGHTRRPSPLACSRPTLAARAGPSASTFASGPRSLAEQGSGIAARARRAGERRELRPRCTRAGPGRRTPHFNGYPAPISPATTRAPEASASTRATPRKPERARARHKALRPEASPSGTTRAASRPSGREPSPADPHAIPLVGPRGSPVDLAARRTESTREAVHNCGRLDCGEHPALADCG